MGFYRQVRNFEVLEIFLTQFCKSLDRTLFEKLGSYISVITVNTFCTAISKSDMKQKISAWGVHEQRRKTQATERKGEGENVIYPLVHERSFEIIRRILKLYFKILCNHNQLLWCVLPLRRAWVRSLKILWYWCNEKR